MSIKFYTSKKEAIRNKREDSILFNKDLTEYAWIQDHTCLLQLIKNNETKHFYEFIPKGSPVNLFFDIEIYKSKHPNEFENALDVINVLKNSIQNVFSNEHNFYFIILQSHSEIKKSFHIIVRIKNKNGEHIYFTSVEYLKIFIRRMNEIKNYIRQKIIDTSVYREGLFRTYLCSKRDENRPLIKSELSDNFEDERLTFVTFCPEPIVFEKIEIERETNVSSSFDIGSHDESITKEQKEIIFNFITKFYRHKKRNVREIFIDNTIPCITVSLNELFCEFIEREHRSNHQYIIIDLTSSKQKCHDTDCNNKRYNEILFLDFPEALKLVVQDLLQQSSEDLIQKAAIESKEYIQSNFDSDVKDISFDKNEMVFRGRGSEISNGIRLLGKCQSCNLEHQITPQGYCLKCNICNTIFPKNQMIQVDSKYQNLNSFWANYNQLVNHGTVVVNNYYNTEEDTSLECKINDNIFNDPVLTKLINESLDGHKITKLSELLRLTYDNYVYDDEWYVFENSIWKVDKDNIHMRRSILELCNLFGQVKKYYTSRASEDSYKIAKNIKALDNKLSKPGFKDEIIKEAKLYYNQTKFRHNLNSKKHIIPFLNGVYDLLTNTFRETQKSDYINLTMGYNYDVTIHNEEVYTFLEQVLPITSVRNFVLKKMSECLNGDIPNTNFLMFIGDSGANGKSQLLNLMKLTMGDFGEKVEVTLLTRKRNNANEANTEKMKLMHKRFAFLSEPEDGEKINIGLLKELTGSEEIVARGLYQDSMSFVMEAKLFLACNELPEIKGEDTALWRRIRVIDFPSRFVDEPQEENEYPIDRTLPSRMREDITWRQTFMNILLKFHFQSIPEPDEVKIKTDEYRKENNEILNFIVNNICYSKGDYIELRDVCQLFFNNKSKVGVKEKGKLRKEIERVIKSSYPEINNECQRTTIDGKPFQGWVDLKFKE
jgi:P4 family phage/plasmid primase-like protien